MPMVQAETGLRSGPPRRAPLTARRRRRRARSPIAREARPPPAR